MCGDSTATSERGIAWSAGASKASAGEALGHDRTARLEAKVDPENPELALVRKMY